MMIKARAESLDRRVITWTSVVLIGGRVEYVVTDSQGNYQKKWSRYADAVSDYLKRLDELWDRGEV